MRNLELMDLYARIPANTQLVPYNSVNTPRLPTNAVNSRRGRSRSRRKNYVPRNNGPGNQVELRSANRSMVV